MQIEHINLNKLSLDPANVRKAKGEAKAIAALAANIAAVGLIHPLAARPNGKAGHYQVFAGGRRLAAYRLLAEDKKLKKSAPVPCIIDDSGNVAIKSLSENAQREALCPADQIDAFAAMKEDGKTNKDIAAAFAFSQGHVRRMLALAGVAPEVITALREDCLSVADVQTFTLACDHQRQREVLASVLAGELERYNLRKVLCDASITADSRLARFVGLDAYKKAGGSITRDLFDDRAPLLNDPELVHTLASEKTEAFCQPYRDEGWTLEIDLDQSTHNIWQYDRAMPAYVYSKKDQAQLDKLEVGLEAPDDWRVEDDIARKIDAIKERSEVWSEDLKAKSFRVVNLTYQGELEISAPLLPQGALVNTTGNGQEITMAEKPEYAASLVADLTEEKTKITQLELAANPHLACALLAAQLLTPILAIEGKTGLGVDLTPFPNHSGRMGDAEPAAFPDILAELHKNLPGNSQELFLHLVKQSKDKLMSLLAVAAAFSLNLQKQKGDRDGDPRFVMGDLLVSTLDFDMANSWEANSDFLARIPAKRIVEILTEQFGADSAEVQVVTAAKGKAAKVAKAEAALKGTDWLPTPLKPLNT